MSAGDERGGVGLSIPVSARCRACDLRARLDARRDMPLVAVVDELTRLHDATAAGHCIAAPRSLVVAFGDGNKPHDVTVRRDDPGALDPERVGYGESVRRALGRRLP